MLWSVPREWPGETVFIIAGGPSVTQEDVDRLRGRKVIAINSSYEKAPWADYLIFGDGRWWREHESKLKEFTGRIVTVSNAGGHDARLLHLTKVKPPPALSADPRSLVMARTTLQAAINLAVHLGVARIVLLGADMKRAPDGRSHHHSAHPWPVKSGCWDQQMAHLRAVAEPLRRLAVEVINTSLDSRIDWWPKVPLADVIAGVAA